MEEKPKKENQSSNGITFNNPNASFDHVERNQGLPPESILQFGANGQSNKTKPFSSKTWILVH